CALQLSISESGHRFSLERELHPARDGSWGRGRTLARASLLRDGTGGEPGPLSGTGAAGWGRVSGNAAVRPVHATAGDPGECVRLRRLLRAKREDRASALQRPAAARLAARTAVRPGAGGGVLPGGSRLFRRCVVAARWAGNRAYRPDHESL